MKRTLVCLAGVAGLLLSSKLVLAQVIVTNSTINEITTTLTSLFAALRNGDVQKVKFFLSDEEYKRQKVLFEQNTEYPAFLRNFYRGAAFRVGEIHSVFNAKDDVVAEFIIEFQGGEEINTRMRLTRDGGGRWVVKKYLAGKYDQGESFGERRR